MRMAKGPEAGVIQTTTGGSRVTTIDTTHAGPATESSGGEPPAVSSIQGANPFVGLNARQLGSAFSRWGGRLLREPSVIASKSLSVAAEDVRILVGASDLAPDPKDKRFADPAWSGPVWRRLAQAYLARREALLGTVDDLDLDEKSRDRARFVLMQVTEAAAPTNNLLTNPTALRVMVDTRGRSLVRGAKNLAWDARHNGGLPSQVDTRPFEVGRTLALTPGGVVKRSELYELLQYEPSTKRVQRRPLVIIPPQVNKFYFLDLAPGRSFIEHAVSQGLQVFTMSWRNPGPDQREWSLDDYVAACLEAIETACAITGSEDANVIGFCAGGITQSLLLGHLAATGRPLVHASTLAVTTIDTTAKSVMNMFVSERSMAASIDKSRRKGVLEGRQLNRVFAWVRPNDLVWNYWVSNYLLGQSPPAFDILAWNGDSTNLPAALHAEFVRLMVDNALVHPGTVEVLGSPVDLSQVKTDLYVVGAATDHIVPWQTTYVATQVYGGDSRFVLSNSGHIQALINPPDNPKASYSCSDDHPPDPEIWLKGATKQTGSWWSDWAAWMIERSGEERVAPRRLGDADHPVLCAAPGTYVRRVAPGVAEAEDTAPGGGRR